MGRGEQGTEVSGWRKWRCSRDRWLKIWGFPRAAKAGAGALMTGFCQPCTVTQLFLSADHQSLSWDVLSAHSTSVTMAVQPGHAGWHGNLVKSFASSSENF